MNIQLKASTIILIAALIFGFYMWNTGRLQITQPTPTATVGLVDVTKPIQFSLNDPLAGAAIGTAAISVYGADKVMKESLTTASTGIVTSALPYTSGAVVYVKTAKTGYVTRWFQISIPQMSTSDAQSLTSNYVALQTITLGTYTIKVTDQFGTSYTTSSTKLNFTALGVSTCSVTVTVYNTADNTGYVSSYDHLNAINLNAVLMSETTGSKAVVTGAGSSVSRGTSRYWTSTASDEGLTRQLVGNVYTKPGVSSMTITFGKGSLVAGNTENYVFTLNKYFDQNYFATNGIGGPDAASMATFTLILAA